MSNPILRFLIGADTSRLKRDLTRGEKAIASLKAAAMRMGGVLAAVFAVNKIKDFFKSSLEGADSQAKAIAKVNQALITTGGAAGLTSKQLHNIAKGLDAITLFDDDQILNDVTAQLLTFTNIAGMNFKRAQVAALDLSTVLGSDLQSTAIQLGKALNDPVKGLTALQKSGISFSAAQKDVIKNLAETGRLAEAQGLILDELSRQYGGQAEAAANAGLGPIDKLRKAWDGVKDDIGTALIPTINKLATKLSKTLPDAIKNTILYFKYFRLGIAKISESLRIASANFSFFTKWISNPFAGAGRKAQWAADFAKDVASAQKTYEDFAQDLFGTKPNYMHMGRGYKAPTGGGGGDAPDPDPKPPTKREPKKSPIDNLRAYRNVQEEVIGVTEKATAAHVQHAMQLQNVGDAANILTPRITTLTHMTTVQSEGMQQLIAGWREFTFQLRDTTLAYNAFMAASAAANTQEITSLNEYMAAVWETTKSIVKAKLNEAIAGAVSKALSNVPFPLNIALAAAAGAATSVAFNAILPTKMAMGGIIPSGFSNDSYPAMLSSGETVLPKPRGLGTGGSDVNIHGVIFGDNLLLVNQRSSKRYNYIRGY